MGSIINAFIARRWLTIAGIVLVFVGIVQPSKGLGIGLIALGVLLMVIQTLIRVTSSLRSHKDTTAPRPL